jgi:hypothetical protein
MRLTALAATAIIAASPAMALCGGHPNAAEMTMHHFVGGKYQASRRGRNRRAALHSQRAF